MELEGRYREARRVTIVGSVANFFIAIVKFVIGFMAHSKAMIADAAHSFSDLSSDLVVLFSLRAAKRPEDATHNYGHGKIETLASVSIGLLLVVVAIGILLSAISSFYAHFNGLRVAAPGWAAFYAALFSAIAKELLYQYSMRTAKRIKSDLMLANAWHHRSDALSSLAVLIGILGSILLGGDWRLLDPGAAIVVSFFVIRVAWKILRKGVSELLEASLPAEKENRIKELVMEVHGVMAFHNLRTRSVGINISVDVHIKVSPRLDVVQAHNIATEVEEALRKEFGDGSFVSVHVEPFFA